MTLTVLAVPGLALFTPVTAMAGDNKPPTSTDNLQGAAGLEGDDERSLALPAPALSSDDLAAAAAKEDDVSRHTEQRRFPHALSSQEQSLVAGATCGLSACAYNEVAAITQVAQQTSYYCGPATAVELLKAKSISISQATAASKLGTTSSGTAWSNGSGYPVKNVLTSYTSPKGFNYSVQALGYTPTSTDKSNLAKRLVTDVDKGYGIAGNAYEVANGPHLAGHPLGRNIYHRFALRGYDSNGGLTKYADSVAGASSISWSASVPRYYSMSTSTVATIMGDRGCVW